MSFKLIHLKIESKDFKPIFKGANDNRTIAEMRPNYNLLMKLIKVVGRDSNWHLRREYAEPSSVVGLKAKIEDSASRLFLFKEANDVVGFCQVLNSNIMNTLFENTDDVIEIYKFGLFPDRIGQGRGQFFLSTVLEKLFNDYKTVYLNTRDTNKIKSVHFYQRMGMQVIGEEQKPDDLILPQSEFGASLTRNPSILSSNMIWQERREFSWTSKA